MYELTELLELQMSGIGHVRQFRFSVDYFHARSDMFWCRCCRECEWSSIIYHWLWMEWNWNSYQKQIEWNCVIFNLIFRRWFVDSLEIIFMVLTRKVFLFQLIKAKATNEWEIKIKVMTIPKQMWEFKFRHIRREYGAASRKRAFKDVQSAYMWDRFIEFVRKIFYIVESKSKIHIVETTSTTMTTTFNCQYENEMNSKWTTEKSQKKKQIKSQINSIIIPSSTSRLLWDSRHFFLFLFFSFFLAFLTHSLTGIVSSPLPQIYEYFSTQNAIKQTSFLSSRLFVPHFS